MPSFNGLEEETTMGPMSNVRRIESMENLDQDAVTRGSKLLTGGKYIGQVGFLLGTDNTDRCSGRLLNNASRTIWGTSSAHSF